ncbi:hypothetical protein K461DRAFT_307882 [Myriangium duriaei CBS 260.36]|uniref:BTB domain-containing protein n=1 Tax=Myriangium duriaei CBS 260.36 TaxID=1168546 RepID=A0A9P4IX49_9PEZI|nr:hypothetical protein K461DRAFT_307882 [Myriangium duriaei CBS 260.36]
MSALKAANPRWDKSLPESIRPDTLLRFVNLQFCSLYSSGDLSDCKIKLATKTVKLHTIVLTRACKYFEKAFMGSFKEGKSRELDLSDDDENVVEMMLKFMYYFSEAAIYGKESDESFWSRKIDLYILADRFGYEPLKNSLANTFLDVKDIKRMKFTANSFFAFLKAVENGGPLGEERFKKLMEDAIRNNMRLIKKLTVTDREAWFKRLPSISSIIVQILFDNIGTLALYRCTKRGCVFYGHVSSRDNYVTCGRCDWRDSDHVKVSSDF